jgi:hypothetical protein
MGLRSVLRVVVGRRHLGDFALGVNYQLLFGEGYGLSGLAFGELGLLRGLE